MFLLLNAGFIYLEVFLQTVQSNGIISRGDYDGSSKSYGFTFTHVSGGNYTLNHMWSTSGTTWSTSSCGATALSHNTWHHFAFCRNGVSMYFFIDGQLITTNTLTISSFPFVDQSYGYPTVLGGFYSSIVTNRYPFVNGYLDELRLTPNICRYTQSFTPPTAEFEYAPLSTQNITFYESFPIIDPNWAMVDENCAIHQVSNNDEYSTKNVFYGGNETISGKITKNGQPFSCNVSLITIDFQLIETTQTDPVTGNYSFPDYSLSFEYLICAIDPDASPNYGAKMQKVSQQTNIEFNDQNLIDLAVYHGTGIIYGTVKNIEGAPLERRVTLLNPITYKKIKTVMSSAVNGTYEFTDLDDTKNYVVVAEDTTPRLYNDIIRIATA